LKIFKADPFAVLDQEGVGKLVEMAVKLGPHGRIWKWGFAESTGGNRVRWSFAIE
jgi:hypothetical protein